MRGVTHVLSQETSSRAAVHWHGGWSVCSGHSRCGRTGLEQVLRVLLPVQAAFSAGRVYGICACRRLPLFAGLFVCFGGFLACDLNAIRDWKRFQATLNQPFDKGGVDEVSGFVPNPLVVTHITGISAYDGAGLQLFCVELTNS